MAHQSDPNCRRFSAVLSGWSQGPGQDHAHVHGRRCRGAGADVPRAAQVLPWEPSHAAVTHQREGRAGAYLVSWEVMSGGG